MNRLRISILSATLFGSVVYSPGCRAMEHRRLALHGVYSKVEAQIRTELFFGLSRPNGADVTADEFSQFLTEEVSPRFPQGFTVLQSQGQWRERTGQVRTEPSRVVILIHPNQPEFDQKIEEIRNVYKSRFQQEAVLRTDEWQGVSF